MLISSEVLACSCLASSTLDSISLNLAVNWSSSNVWFSIFFFINSQDVLVIRFFRAHTCAWLNLRFACCLWYLLAVSAWDLSLVAWSFISWIKSWTLDKFSFVSLSLNSVSFLLSLYLDTPAASSKNPLRSSGFASTICVILFWAIIAYPLAPKPVPKNKSATSFRLTTVLLIR